MAHNTSVDTPPVVEHASDAGFVPDSPEALFGAFASVDVVGAAAASLDVLGTHADAAEWLHWTGRSVYAGKGWAGGFDPGFGTREGVVWRMEVSPGTIAFRRRDYTRAEATVERSIASTEDELSKRDMFDRLDAEVAERVELKRRGRVTSWSRKSRAKMVETLATLDYSPMTSGGRAPAMLTLTYPGDWLAVAPSAEVCADHVVKFRKRYARRWGHALIGTWKREFQTRGAPHYHVLMVPPAGRAFDEWVARTWAAIVGASSCGAPAPEWGDRVSCCERHRHEAAHLHESVVDRREGARYTDPRRVGVYFSKHGSFSAKDYQNEAPAEWLADPEAGVGRFWGVWGLDKAVAAVHVEPDVSDALRRVVRRWEASLPLRQGARDRVVVDHGDQVKVYRAPSAPAVMVTTVWRKRTTVDRETGEIGFRWVKRRTTKRIRPRLSGRAGFITVNDAPSLAMDLGRYASLRASTHDLEAASHSHAG